MTTSSRPQSTIKPHPKHPAWKALREHHAKIKNVHLRQLFAEDPRRGERFAPLGMTAETTVAAFLKNAKVPAAARGRVVVVEVDGAAAWLAPPGGRPARVAESHRVTESSDCTLHIVEEAR